MNKCIDKLLDKFILLCASKMECCWFFVKEYNIETEIVIWSMFYSSQPK